MALTKIDDRGLKTPIDLQDNEKIRLGTGNDLEVYHSGTNSVIDNNTGSLYIRANVASDVGGDIFIQAKSGEDSAKFTHDGSVELRYDGTLKLKTQSFGADVFGLLQIQGNCIPDSNNSHDLGTSSARWRNVYTNDLNLSNKGSSNDVDGTWGDWTIQEGESDLFLKNNRSGKKYKFNLTEVS